MLAIGNEELGETIEEIQCECGEVHPIEYGTVRTFIDGGWSEPKPSKGVGFYQCDGALYVASFNGRAISRGKVDDESNAI